MGRDRRTTLQGATFSSKRYLGGNNEELRLAKCLRTVFADSPQRVGGDIFRCTVSIGLAVTDATCSNLYLLLGNADRALYRAKKAGRNRALMEGAHQQLALPGVA